MPQNADRRDSTFLLRACACSTLPWSRERRARLMAARSSLDLACCWRATARARSNCFSASNASVLGDLCAISPAMRFISASHHVKCCLLPFFHCAPHALEPFCHRDDCLGDAKVSLSWPGDSDGSSPRRRAKPISSRDIAST